MDATLDLFEDLKNAVGCEYISHLRLIKYKRKAKKALKKIDLNMYSTYQLTDMADYIYGKKTCDREAAISVLIG